MADFSTVLPFQAQAWAQVSAQYRTKRLAHALLAGGMAGLGKRAFVWRLVAWALCHKPSALHACGHCSSCTLLHAGTHPNLRLLPSTSTGKQASIKIDDVRALHDFVYHTGDTRFIVLDHSETMTVAAANALLKMLEEPKDGVFFILISDNPVELLPTITSRVQRLPLSPLDLGQVSAFVAEQLALSQANSTAPCQSQAMLLLRLADFAPLQALALPKMPWFLYRKTWLQTFAVLQKGSRTVLQASDYWQSVLALADFLALSQQMMGELWRYGLGLPPLHSDIAGVEIIADIPLTMPQLSQIDSRLYHIRLALTQNVQDKLAYDTAISALGTPAL